MSYLGKVDMNDANIKHYSLTGSTLTTVDIGWVPPSEQSLRVTINGVVQQGGTFSLSGSNLTLGGALVATDDLEVVGIQSVGNLITPADDSVTTAKIADDAVTLAKMAGGTDGNLITYDASGDPAHVATGTATHVLTSNGAGAAPTFQEAAAGGLTQASQWRLHTTFSSNSNPITSNLEENDTDGYGRLGSAMTESSGVFAFPVTGYWLVQANFFLVQASNGTGGNACNLSTTTDNGSSWEGGASEFTMGDYYGDKYEGTINYLFKVTDTSQDKVRFGVNTSLTDTETRGSSTQSLTYFNFLKLADI
jgi:hypothetical protein